VVLYGGADFVGQGFLVGWGFGKVAVVPSVNVGYKDVESREAKERHAYVREVLEGGV